MQTRQLPTTPRLPPPKRAPSRGERRQKRMAAKMRPKRARRAALTPRAPQHSARQAGLCDRCDSGPFACSRAPQTSTDVETSKTAQPTALSLDGVEPNAPSRQRRETSFKMCRVDGVFCGVEVPSRMRAGAGAAALQPPIDRPGRTCSTEGSPRRRSSLEQQRGPSKGPRASSSPAGKWRRVDGLYHGDGVLVE